MSSTPFFSQCVLFNTYIAPLLKRNNLAFLIGFFFNPLDHYHVYCWASFYVRPYWTSYYFNLFTKIWLMSTVCLNDSVYAGAVSDPSERPWGDPKLLLIDPSAAGQLGSFTNTQSEDKARMNRSFAAIYLVGRTDGLSHHLGWWYS